MWRRCRARVDPVENTSGRKHQCTCRTLKHRAPLFSIGHCYRVLQSGFCFFCRATFVQVEARHGGRTIWRSVHAAGGRLRGRARSGFRYKTKPVPPSASESRNAILQDWGNISQATNLDLRKPWYGDCHAGSSVPRLNLQTRCRRAADSQSTGAPSAGCRQGSTSGWGGETASSKGCPMLWDARCSVRHAARCVVAPGACVRSGGVAPASGPHGTHGLRAPSRRNVVSERRALRGTCTTAVRAIGPRVRQQRGIHPCRSVWHPAVLRMQLWWNALLIAPG